MLKALSGVYERHMVAVILTGMGSDGTQGAIAARRQGAYVLVEDPRTAVMPGMPHSALEAGAVDRALPLERLHEAIIEVVEKRRAEREGT
jgi:two-component system chemotaxis response regulator CheB